MNRKKYYKLISTLAFLTTCVLFTLGKTDLAIFAAFAALYFNISEVSEIIESALLEDEDG